MSKNKPKPPKCGRVTYVSVSRLFNLGNYCNRKIGLSAEVATGQSATQTLSNLWWIIERLGPIKTPYCKAQYEECQKLPAESQTEYQKANVAEWAKEMAACALKKQERVDALKMLDDLGGVTEFTDHKDKWDFNDDTPF